jgi:hypothetical protein
MTHQRRNKAPVKVNFLEQEELAEQKGLRKNVKILTFMKNYFNK